MAKQLTKTYGTPLLLRILCYLEMKLVSLGFAFCIPIIYCWLSQTKCDNNNMDSQYCAGKKTSRLVTNREAIRGGLKKGVLERKDRENQGEFNYHMGLAP